MLPMNVNPHYLSSPLDPRTHFRLRKREARDLPEIRAMMQRVYPPPHGPESVWSEGALALHLEIFPEGQFVAHSNDGRLIGSATSMLVPLEVALHPHTWREITGRGTLGTHDPAGNSLYGVNIAVDPDYQGHGIGHGLYLARFNLANELGCDAMVAGARIPGYHRYASAMSAEAYIEAVVAGQLWDPTLSKQLKVGFEVSGVLPGYAPDHETHGYAALILRYLKAGHAV